MAKLALLGLGVMGYPMAGHLQKKGGHQVTAYNRTGAKAQQWAGEFGGQHAASPREAAVQGEPGRQRRACGSPGRRTGVCETRQLGWRVGGRRELEGSGAVLGDG